jgi:hypothetical protein
MSRTKVIKGDAACRAWLAARGIGKPAEPTREQQLEEALSSLANSLPECDCCPGRATSVYYNYGEQELYCEKHAKSRREAVRVKWAEPLRAAIALLEGDGEEG